MQRIFVDESGTMAVSRFDDFPHFVIALVLIHDEKRMNKVLRRFIGKNISALREVDQANKMFREGRFVELKGSALNRDLKIRLAEYLCNNNILEVFYVRIDNAFVAERLYKNRARAFNYIITQALEKVLEKGILPFDDYFITLDERNERAVNRNFLEEYFNIYLGIDKDLGANFHVTYCDSCNQPMVQIADIFSNLYFSQCMTGGYGELMARLKLEGYIRYEYFFPKLPSDIDILLEEEYNNSVTVSPATKP